MTRKFLIAQRPEISGHISDIIADGIVQEGNYFNFYNRIPSTKENGESLTVVAVVCCDFVRDISSVEIEESKTPPPEDIPF